MSAEQAALSSAQDARILPRMSLAVNIPPPVPLLSKEQIIPAKRTMLAAKLPDQFDAHAPLRLALITHRLAITPDVFMGYGADGNPVMEVKVSRGLMERLRPLQAGETTVVDVLPHIEHLLPTASEFAPRKGRLVHLFHRNYRRTPALSPDRLRPHLEMMYILRRACDIARGESSDPYGLNLSLRISDGRTTLSIQARRRPPAQVEEIVEKSADVVLARRLRNQARREQILFHKVVDRHERGYPCGAIARCLGSSYDKRALSRWLKNGTTGAHSMLRYYHERHADRVEQLRVQPLTPVAAFALGCLCGGMQNKSQSLKRLNFLYPASNERFTRGISKLFGTKVSVGEYVRRDGVVHNVDDRAVVTACRNLCDDGRAIPLGLLATPPLRCAFVAGFLQHKHSFSRVGYVATFRKDRRKGVQFASILASIDIVPFVHFSNGTSVIVRDEASLRFLKALRHAAWEAGGAGFDDRMKELCSHRSETVDASPLRSRIAMLGRRHHVNQLSAVQKRLIDRSPVKDAVRPLPEVHELPVAQISAQLGMVGLDASNCVQGVLHAFYEGLLKQARSVILTYGRTSKLEPEDLAQEVAIRSRDILEQWDPRRSSLRTYFLNRAWGIMVTEVSRALPFGRRAAQIAKEARMTGEEANTIEEIQAKYHCQPHTARLVLGLRGHGGVGSFDETQIVMENDRGTPREATLAEIVPDLMSADPETRAIVLLYANNRTPSQICAQLGCDLERVVEILASHRSYV